MLCFNVIKCLITEGQLLYIFKYFFYENTFWLKSFKLIIPNLEGYNTHTLLNSVAFMQYNTDD